MFGHVSVHLSVCPRGGGGVPHLARQGGTLARSSWGVGTPAKSDWRGTLSQVWPRGGGGRSGLPPGQVWWGRVPQPGLMEGTPEVGYPQQGWGTPQPGVAWGYLARSNGVVPEVGYPLSRNGVPPVRGYPPSPLQDNRWSTWYAAVGTPLAFTQEDFLV